MIQQVRVGAYLMKQRLKGNKRYPLVLMLEPLYRCNLACSGCGKIDYPDHILNQRMSVEECVAAVEECGAPMVAIPGGEPLLHKEIDKIVEAIVARKKFVYMCTNALLLEKNLDRFTPSKYFTIQVHLDGMRDHHDRAVDQKGTFDIAIKAIREAQRRGFRVNINCTLFDQMTAQEAAEFFDFCTHDLGVEGSRYRRATPTSARPTRSISSIATRPNSSSATSSNAARARSGRSASRRCSSISWPATSRTAAPRGRTRRAASSAGSGRATSSARGTSRPSRS